MDSKIGVVVFFDLAGYSQSEIPVQAQLGNAFMTTLRDTVVTLYPDTPPIRSAGCPYLILPTGDGAAVVLWNQAPTHPRVEFTAVWLGGQLLAWAQSHTPPIGLRCGINAGPLEFVTDPYGTINVCGTPINEAQRIMDAAQDGQLLVHAEHFAARLYSAEERLHADFHYRLHAEQHEILVKHGKILRVQTITGAFRGANGEQAFGQAGEPANKWYLQIDPPRTQHDAYGIEIKQPFKEMLLDSTQMAFVGATHDQLPAVFQDALATHPGKRWRRVAFFFLTDEALQSIQSDGRAYDDLVKAKRGAREALAGLLCERVRSLEFREYRFPFFFAAFLDWEAPGGRIHVSPYVWGFNVRECPGLDYRWVTRQPTQAYQAYCRGLEQLSREAWSHAF